MKSFAVASVLLGCFLLFANADKDQMDHGYFVNKGKECIGHCGLNAQTGLRHGYFNESRLLTIDGNVNYKIKYLWSQTPTNFVVHIKNIQVSGPMQICYYSDYYRMDICEAFNSADDQIFSITGTRQVKLYAANGVQFHVQYYAGCGILDGKDLVLARKTGRFSDTPGYCWIMIPREFNGGTNQWTALTNVFFYNNTVPKGVEVNLYNLLSGEHLLNLESSEVDLANVEASKNAISYQKTKTLSTVLFLNVESCPDGSCTGLEFVMKTQTLLQKNLDCFRAKQDCEFPFPGTECTQQDKEEECEAYTKFIDMLDDTSGASDEGRRYGKRRSKQCAWNFRGRTKQVLCAKKANGDYKVGCEKLHPCIVWCFDQRVTKKICKKSLRVYQ